MDAEPRCRNRTIQAALVIAGAFALVATSLLTCLHVEHARSAVTPVIDDRINPNYAPSASLMRLPGIGPARAQAIIDFRNARMTPGAAFAKPSDLEEIRGIGPATVAAIEPWLSFE